MHPIIYLPKTAAAGKVDKLRSQGAQIVLFGDDAVEAELEARQIANKLKLVYVSPYNDLQVKVCQ